MANLKLKYITKKIPLITSRQGDTNVTQFWWPLRGVDLELNPGEAIGLLGFNGSGKSLLLNIIGGKVKQTTGFLTCQSRINLASLNNDFDLNHSGIENIKNQVAKLAGDKTKHTHTVNDIVNFIDIGHWIYQPVSTYAIEIKARLALGLALFLDPQIVLIDEILNLLDNPFYQRVVGKIQTLKDNGTSFIIADSRSLTIETLCERSLWLQFGQVQDQGSTLEVVQQYEFVNNWFHNLTLPEKNEFLAIKEKEQVDFDIDDLYEQFKTEQYQNGLTRTDEPKMRQKFFVERGQDPIDQMKKVEDKKAEKPEPTKKKGSWGKLLVALIIIAGGGWFGYEKYSAGHHQATPKTEHQAKSKPSHASSGASVKKSEKPVKDSEHTKAKKATEKKAVKKEAAIQTINIASGDTLESLAAKYQTTPKKIQELNHMGNSVDLKLGAVLRVPK